MWLRVTVDSSLVRLTRRLGVSPVGDAVARALRDHTPWSGFRRVEEYGRPGREEWSVAFDLLVQLKQPGHGAPGAPCHRTYRWSTAPAQREDDCTDVQVHGSRKFLAVVQHQKAGR